MTLFVKGGDLGLEKRINGTDLRLRALVCRFFVCISMLDQHSQMPKPFCSAFKDFSDRFDPTSLSPSPLASFLSVNLKVCLDNPPATSVVCIFCEARSKPSNCRRRARSKSLPALPRPTLRQASNSKILANSISFQAQVSWPLLSTFARPAPATTLARRVCFVK